MLEQITWLLYVSTALAVLRMSSYQFVSCQLVMLRGRYSSLHAQRCSQTVLPVVTVFCSLTPCFILFV